MTASRTGVSAQVRRKRAKASVCWAEFYIPSEDRGITFAIVDSSLCGDILRLRLPPGPGVVEPWRFVLMTKSDDFKVDGKIWTDFGVSAVRAPYLKKLSRRYVASMAGLFE
jgi:hypothetical protein